MAKTTKKTTQKTSGKSSAKKILQAQMTARIFGFKKEGSLSVSKDVIKNVDSYKKDKDFLDPNMFAMEEAFVRLSNYKEVHGKDYSEPDIFYTEGTLSGTHKKNRKKPGEEIINLNIINVNTSIAEATIIKTAEAILADHGIKKIKILVNNIGGPEAQLNYTKEATSYYRKHINDLTSNCRQLFKESLHALIANGSDECTEIHEEAPKPMEFLDEASKKRFGEVIEFLEIFGSDYDIDQSIIGDPNYSSNTVFKIIDQNTGKTVAAGSRYDHLARKCGLRKDIPAIGISINVPKPKKISESSLSKIEKSKFYFLHLGFEAKLRAFDVIDQLRKSNIYLQHKLHKDKLSTQLGSAKKSGAEYYVIMGQKEAMENELIVRDKEAHSQYIINNREIVDYLKKL
jgi:histidyl-tRNA synthetase